MDVDMELVKTFGFNSMRDINKFENGNFEVVENINVIKDSLGYMICDVVDMIDNETHTLFIGRMYEGDVYQDSEVMTYGYYQEHKDELLKVKTERGKTAWVCNLCGYVYYGEELPDDFICPICGVGKENFSKK
jgi:rubredoxin